MTNKRVVMIAAEDGALPGGRVTSIGEMTRALPAALGALGWDSTIVSPAYGVHGDHAQAHEVGTLSVRFAGATHSVTVYKIRLDETSGEHLVLDHALFSPQGPGRIYCHDEPASPFATDATKFAFFCAAAAALVRAMPTPPDAVHIHDWHAALYFALRAFDPDCLALRAIRTVFTIHSLALQGRRPLSFTSSSLRSWYPTLSMPRAAVIDPLFDDCANPTATAVRLADAISVGSPTFAKEIQRAGNTERGRDGGYGLHELLRTAQRERRLVGILDGCLYAAKAGRKPAWRTLAQALRAHNTRWLAGTRTMRSAHYIADQDMTALPRTRPAVVLTACGPLGDNEMALLRQPTARGISALEAIIESLKGNERFILLGAGNPEHEQFCTQIAAQYERFVFLCGPPMESAQDLYRAGDIHLLPHTSAAGPGPALRALRAGQPCVAHAVGGLADVVKHDVNGWLFRGTSRQAQARNFVRTVLAACAVRRAGAQAFAVHSRAAAATRHDWTSAATKLIARLYTGD